MLQKNWENCKDNKGNNKFQTRSQDNTLTLIQYLQDYAENCLCLNVYLYIVFLYLNNQVKRQIFNIIMKSKCGIKSKMLLYITFYFYK